jgi:hypothetical protein
MAQREIKKVDPTSLGKVLGVLYALLGFIIGLFFAAFGSIFSGLMNSVGGDEASTSTFSTLFGVGSIIFFPIFYGIIGLIGGVLMGFLYNLVAGWVGGVKMEVGE